MITTTNLFQYGNRGGATDGTRTATIPADQIPANTAYIRCSGTKTVMDNYVIPFDLYNVLVNLATKTDVNTVIAQINTYLNGSYVYRGWAIPSTVPASDKSNVFYLATEPGLYTNFGNFEVTNRLTVFRRTNPDLRDLKNDVREIKEQNRRRRYVDGNGNVIEVYKNLTRKIKK